MTSEEPELCPEKDEPPELDPPEKDEPPEPDEPPVVEPGPTPKPDSGMQSVAVADRQPTQPYELVTSVAISRAASGPPARPATG